MLSKLWSVMVASGSDGGGGDDDDDKNENKKTLDFHTLVGLTFLNGERIESARYYELKGTDMLKFGTSTREYVLVDAGAAVE